MNTVYSHTHLKDRSGCGLEEWYHTWMPNVCGEHSDLAFDRYVAQIF